MPIAWIKTISSYYPPMGEGDKKMDDEKIKRACMDFESIFIHQMLKSMRQTVPKAGLFGEGSERETFQSLFDQEVSRSLAHQGGLGIGKMLYRQMMRHRNAGPSDVAETSLEMKSDRRSIPTE